MENEKQLQLAPENLQVALPSEQITALFATVSHLQITTEESQKLTAPFPDEVVEIRPDGHIYIPQTYYRQRLNEVLGIGQWGLIQKGSYQDVTEKEGKTKTKFYLPGILVIRKCMVSEAVGEAELHDDNDQQSAASCWEAAKSDCITRCCKDLSIGTQVYQPNYIREWQKNHAVRVWVEKKTKPQWRRRDAIAFWNEKGIVDENKPSAGNAFMNHPEHTKPWLNKYTKSGGITGEWNKLEKDINEGRLTAIAEIDAAFRINGETKNEVLRMLKDAKEKKSPPTKEQVTKALQACKTKQEVDHLALQHKPMLEADTDFKLLFGRVKFTLPQQAKQTA